jgi:hypothetical protein
MMLVALAFAAAVTTSGDLAPFSAPDALTKETRSFVGKSCAGIWGDKPGFMTGYKQPNADFRNIATQHGMIFAREKQGSRFAFLAAIPGDGKCDIKDVVTLPPASKANAWLQCDSGNPPDMHFGFGMRKAGIKKLVGYWEFDEAAGKILRAKPAADTMCQEPEFAD